MPSALDVVMAQVEAWASRDLERFMAFFSPHCKVEDGQGTVLMDGAEAMRGVYGPLFANSPDIFIRIPNRIESGPYVILEEDCGGMNLPGYPESIRCAVAYRVDDGVITNMRFLW